MKPIDISNKRFGRLLALSPYKKTNQGIVWNFLCECGNECTKLAKTVKINSDKKSCGCLQKEIWSNRCKKLNYKHGMTNTKEFKSWTSMLSRCESTTNPKYYLYGGRGIYVCESWHIFLNFYNDMGERPDNYTLDRINPNGNYEPSNCRWASHLTQRHNRRPKNNRLVI